MENLKLDGQFNKEKERIYIDVVEKFKETKKHMRIVAHALGEEVDESKL